MALDRSRLGKRLANIEREVAEIKEVLQWLRPKRGLSFYEALPPRSICRDLVSKMENATRYDGFLAFLSEYYSVPRMRLYWDESRVSAKYVAIYSPKEGAAYSHSKTISQHTVLHEFFHHLVAHGVVIIRENDEEQELADQFATAVLSRGQP